MQEGINLEFKSEFTKSFLKTVSAFANYVDGEIVFGVSDDGEPLGVEDPKGLCLKIENSINDSLEPLPTYSLNVRDLDDCTVVVLKVFRGQDTPYCVSGKAYKRSHTSTVKVDSAELRRLVLNGTNTSFEECPAKNQDLKFEVLDSMLEQKLDLKEVDEKVYRTLELYTSANGFNNAAAVLADENEFPGIDIVRFGDSINEFMDRKTLDHVSALTLYEEAMTMFELYYKYEVVSGFTRKVETLVPEEAYREAVANALVHRIWDIQAMIRVSMFQDRIEVSSPGGLPNDVSEQDYLAGRLSVLRNPIIAGVLAKLGFIEKFGTGIPRIMEAYVSASVNPNFLISDSSITVILPTLSLGENINGPEKKVLELLAAGPMKRAQIEDALGMSKSTVTRTLKRLEGDKLVKREGAGRSTIYRL